MGVAAIAAPLLHSITDLLEWWQGGFGQVQLWLNSAAFLPMPALMVGLGLLPLPEVLQTVGSGARNAGLMLIGWHLLRTPARSTVTEGD